MSSIREAYNPAHSAEGKPSRGKRSTFVVEITRDTFDAILDALCLLSKESLEHLNYVKAIRLILPKFDNLQAEDLAILYNTCKAPHMPSFLAGPNSVTFSIALNEADRLKTANLAKVVHAVTGQRLNHSELIVFMMLSVPKLLASDDGKS